MLASFDLSSYHNIIPLYVRTYVRTYVQDWRHDLWSKRFVRDNLRFRDEIQCAAARVVVALRQRAQLRDNNNSNGDFDSFHIRK